MERKLTGHELHEAINDYLEKRDGEGVRPVMSYVLRDSKMGDNFAVVAYDSIKEINETRLKYWGLA